MVGSVTGKHFQDWDVEQGWLFPPSVLDLVPPNLGSRSADLPSGSWLGSRALPPLLPVPVTAGPPDAEVFSRGK